MTYTFHEKKHIHLLGGKPLIGTTTAMKVLAKPLTWWASGMAVGKLGWLDPKKNTPEEVREALATGFEKVKGLDIEGYRKLLAEAYKAHAQRLKESAKTGTDRHAVLQDYVQSCLAKERVLGFEEWELSFKEETGVKNFIDWSVENVERFLFSELNCYSERLWVGGVSDAGAILKDGQKALIDFKSSKEAYPDQFFQCGLYALQIEENGGYTADGIKLLEPTHFDQYLVVPFGANNVVPVPFYDTVTAKEAAEIVVGLYKRIETTNQLLQI